MAYGDEPEYVTVNAYVHRTTQKAVLLSPDVLLSDDGNDDNAKWIPLSQINTSGDLEPDAEVTLEMAEWIATREGFV